MQFVSTHKKYFSEVSVMPPVSAVQISAAWLADVAQKADGGPAQDPETGFQFLSGSHAGNSCAERSLLCRQHASHSRPADLVYWVYPTKC